METYVPGKYVAFAAALKQVEDHFQEKGSADPAASHAWLRDHLWNGSIGSIAMWEGRPTEIDRVDWGRDEVFDRAVQSGEFLMLYPPMCGQALVDRAQLRTAVEGRTPVAASRRTGRPLKYELQRIFAIALAIAEEQGSPDTDEHFVTRVSMLLEAAGDEAPSRPWFQDNILRPLKAARQDYERHHAPKRQK